MHWQRISLPIGGGNYSTHDAILASASVQEALQRRKYVRSESEHRCNRSLPKPPLLLVTREVVRHGGKKTSRRNEERWEMAAKKEKQRELSSGTVWSSILLVHAESGRKRIQFFWLFEIIIRDYASRYFKTMTCCTVSKEFIYFILKIIL